MIELYDPRGTRELHQVPVALRPRALHECTIGLLENGKEHADTLLDRAAELLTERGATVVRARKPSFSLPAPDDVIDALAHCSAVVAAHGG